MGLHGTIYGRRRSRSSTKVVERRGGAGSGSVSLQGSVSGGWTAGGEYGPPRGEGGPEFTASGVPREDFQPGDLAFPQISAPARAPRPLFSPSGNTPFGTRGTLVFFWVPALGSTRPGCWPRPRTSRCGRWRRRRRTRRARRRARPRRYESFSHPCFRPPLHGRGRTQGRCFRPAGSWRPTGTVGARRPGPGAAGRGAEVPICARPVPNSEISLHHSARQCHLARQRGKSSWEMQLVNCNIEPAGTPLLFGAARDEHPTAATRVQVGWRRAPPVARRPPPNTPQLPALAGG